MKPAPRVILLDSCAYFRLARSIHPLLAGSFGPAPPYSLFVLSVLDNEYITSSRLKNKFEWVNSKEYKEDREKKEYSCRGKWAAKAEDAFSFLDFYAKDHDLILAQEDIKALAVGFARHIPIVSDDRGIQQVAEAHSLEWLGTLDLLKLMLDCGHVTLAKVNEVLEYLDQEKDLPMGKTELHERYKVLFGGVCPI